MSIFYVSSMDQYGPAAAATVTGGVGGQTRWGMDNEIFVGDGWTNLPEYTNPSLQWVAVGGLSLAAPSWGARRGDVALLASTMYSGKAPGAGFAASLTRTSEHGLQFAIPGATSTTRYFHIAYSCSALPVERGHGFICDLCDSNGDIRASLRVNSAGRLEVLDGTALSTVSTGTTYTSEPAVLASSAAPVISPETWYSLNIRVICNATDETADVDIYVGDITASNLVISVNGVAFTDTDGAQPAGAANNIDIISFLPASLPANAADSNIRAMRDFVMYDTSGSYNDDFLGQVFCSAQEMRAEDSGGGWQAHPREDIGNGVLNAQENSTGIRLADAAALEIGSSDFTFETRIRFSELPNTTGEIAEILSKWFTPSNLGYRLYYSSDDDGLVWEWSTDGSTSAGTKVAPWVPQTDKWYSIAISRWTDTSGTYTSIFVDGREIGGPTADTATYNDGSGSLGIGANFAGGSTPDSASVFVGFLDETRFTIGTGRYQANYTPLTAKFGRDVGGDTEFANVVLLMGYDDGTVQDESSAARTLTLNANPVTADQPNDGDFSYEVLNQRPAWDDTYIEGTYLYATSVGTFSAQPSNGDTMTIGSQTYTFVTAFSTSPADEIFIGATLADTVANTIAAINGGSGEGTAYGTGTTANTSAAAVNIVSPQFGLQALAIGTTGNSVATTETSASLSFPATTLEGGADLPADSDFAIERLPIDVSGVLAVQATARAYKTAAGTADLRFDLIGPSAGVGAGASQAIDLNPGWVRQIHEEDPDTTAALTPSTIIGGRLRIKRTA